MRPLDGSPSVINIREVSVGKKPFTAEDAESAEKSRT